MITVVCGCGKLLSTQDSNTGKRTRCPACQAPLVIGIPDADSPQSTFLPIALEDTSLFEPKRKPGISQRKRLLAAIQLRMTYFGAGAGTVALAFFLWHFFSPATDWEQVALRNSPEYLLAAMEAPGEKVSEPRIKIYTISLEKLSKYYSEDRRNLAQLSAIASAKLNGAGIAATTYFLIDAGLFVGERMSARLGRNYEKLNYSDFLDAYVVARLDKAGHDGSLTFAEAFLSR